MTEYEWGVKSESWVGEWLEKVNVSSSREEALIDLRDSRRDDPGFCRNVRLVRRPVSSLSWEVVDDKLDPRDSSTEDEVTIPEYAYKVCIDISDGGNWWKTDRVHFLDEVAARDFYRRMLESSEKQPEDFRCPQLFRAPYLTLEPVELVESYDGETGVMNDCDSTCWFTVCGEKDDAFVFIPNPLNR